MICREKWREVIIYLQKEYLVFILVVNIDNDDDGMVKFCSIYHYEYANLYL